MADLTSLLEKLSIKARSQQGLDDELQETELTIFKPLVDLGFFRWKPGNAKYQKLSSIETVADILPFIDLEGKPDALGNTNNLRLPKYFENVKPHTRENKFPYGQLDFACLYIAKERGVDFNEIDFIFGGSTLEMLASRDASDPYILSYVPGTNCILVVKCKDYVKNLADPGFQFERFVIGKKMADTDSSVDSTEHLHLMMVGEYKVLFKAETDALQSNSPVEIKASNPRYWGTKVLLQMISNGSTKLCHGSKYRGCITSVSVRGLVSVANEALRYGHAPALEQNILHGMQEIKSQMKDNGLRRIGFSRSGSLSLLPTSSRAFAILPPDDVVMSMLQKDAT